MILSSKEFHRPTVCVSDSICNTTWLCALGPDCNLKQCVCVHILLWDMLFHPISWFDAYACMCVANNAKSIREAQQPETSMRDDHRSFFSLTTNSRRHFYPLMPSLAGWF